MKDYSKANRGKAFEDLLFAVHGFYQRNGVACVHKIPTEFIPLRNAYGQVVSVKVERKSCVDYLGRFKGIPVAVEAKHSEDDRIRWDRVAEHQAAYMDDFCRDGAVGIVIVSFGMRRFFAVPWEAWRAGLMEWRQTKPRHKQAAVEVEAGGIKWVTPAAASIAVDEFPQEWEIKLGGRVALPYLDLIDQWRRS